MKQIIYITVIFASLVFAACGGKSNGTLDQKKAELDKLRAEIGKLQEKAKKLENEIALLDSTKKDKSKLVEFAVLEEGVFKSYLEIEGKADADQSTIATAKVPAVVTQVLVSAGQVVSAGQALAYLDNSALVQSRAQIEQQLDFAITLFEKQKRLWNQGIGTEVQYLSAKNQKEALEKNLATLNAQIAMYTVTSPINGTIESVDVKIGQSAAPGLPLFKVVNLNQLKIVADVAETYVSKVNQGDAVTVFFPDLDREIQARISFASRIIDPLNRGFSIEIKLPTAQDIRPNMLANIRITDYESKKALTVPTNCIQTGESSSYVMVAVEKDGKLYAERRSIKTGKSSAGKTEVLSGLKAGDKVVINGYQELNEGQLIVVNPSQS